jgi:hypothetical protein
MESNADEILAQQAFQIHQKMNEKHASFIHTRNMDAVQCVYTYQKALSRRELGVLPHVRGFTRDAAFICPLYNLVRLSKSRRNTFLKHLVSIFDSGSGVSVGGLSSQQYLGEIEFYQFIGDSLAYLDYKTQEEVLHVIFYINVILSVGGEELRSALDSLGPGDKADDDQVFRASVYSVMIQVRNFLQKRYGLSFL